MKKSLSVIFTLLLTVVLSVIGLTACGEQKFKVNFMVEGEVYSVTTTGGNAKISMPENPVKQGYVFDGWYFDKDTWKQPLMEDSYIEKALSNDIEVYAKWSICQYTLTIDFGNGEAHEVITQDYGTEITYELPTTLTRVGYTFNGWSESIPSTMPAENKTISAIWVANQYTLTIVYENGEENKVITQDYGTAIESILQPTKVGYTFNGWSESIPSTMPAENKTITASWQINQYTLTIVYDNGEDNEDITQDYGTAIESILEPTKVGYTFNGWSESIPSTMPAEDLTITASWVVNQYTLTIVFGNGEDNEDITQDYGTEITYELPTTLTREYYTFGGWSESVPSTMPAENKTISAIWVANQYTLTIVFGNGEDDEVITQDYGTEITYELPTTLTRVGYTFNGWSESIPTNMPAEDLTITASWIAIFTLSGGRITGLTEHGKALTQITIPTAIDGVSIIGIGSNAFENCTALTSVNYMGTIDSWAQLNFGNAKANPIYYVKNLYINGELVKDVSLTTATKISSYAFYNCATIESVSMGASVGEIGYSSFANCTALESVTIGENVTRIETFAFSTCSNLLGVVIPNNVTSIGQQAFERCTLLGSLTFEENSTLESIGYMAFVNCHALTEVIIPNSVTTVGGFIFQSCSTLKYVTIGNGLTSISENMFGEGVALEKVTFAEGCKITSIGDNAFYGCKKLTSIFLPSGLETIGNYAFYSCSTLDNVIVPNSVTSVGNNAFHNTGLTNVYYLGTASEWANITIGENNGNFASDDFICYYIENEADLPNDGGRYWHYVNGIPLKWE